MERTDRLSSRVGLEKLAGYPYAILTWVGDDGYPMSVAVEAGIDPAAVVTTMRDRYGILIGTGLDKLRTTALRVGHMGITSSPPYVLPTLSALEMTLRDLGYTAEAGAGVAAAQAIFSAQSS